MNHWLSIKCPCITCKSYFYNQKWPIIVCIGQYQSPVCHHHHHWRQHHHHHCMHHHCHHYGYCQCPCAACLFIVFIVVSLATKPSYKRPVLKNLYLRWIKLLLLLLLVLLLKLVTMCCCCCCIRVNLTRLLSANSGWELAVVQRQAYRTYLAHFVHFHRPFRSRHWCW